MLAYVVTASLPEFGEGDHRMLVYNQGSKRDVETLIRQDGWKVKRVRSATIDDVSEIATHDVLLKQLRQAIKDAQVREAEEQRQSAALQRQQVEQARREREERERRAEEIRDLAIAKAAGDIFDFRLEARLRGNTRVASLCAKTLLFFDQASCNKKDIFTAISLDFADLLSQLPCPQANKLMASLVEELNGYLKLDDEVSAINGRLREFLRSGENSANAIASRTHIFGGSGDLLLISWLSANSAAKKDEQAVESIQNSCRDEERRAKGAIELIGMKQQLIEYRAKARISMLLAACGKSDMIEINLPQNLERFVLGMA